MIGEVLDEPRLVALKAERPNEEDTVAHDAWRDEIYPLVAAKLGQLSTDDAFARTSAFACTSTWSS